MKKYLFLITLFLVAALSFSVRSCNRHASESKRLCANQRTLFEQATYYRTKDSLSVASVERLTLTSRELEHNKKDLLRTVEALNLKVRRLQSASTTATTGAYEIAAELKPKIISDDSIFNTASDQAMKEALRTTAIERELHYRTPYINIEGVVVLDSLKAKIQVYDTIIQVVHRVPRKFLFIRWGTKAIRQEVTSKNPHTEITYSEYIELQK